MTVNIGFGEIFPARPALRKIRAVLIIVVVLAALGWTAADIHSLLLVALAALGIMALSS
ncbi:hypothetical protein ACTG9Q_09690 [Actinokineospora sp. 24-640]